MPQDEPQKPLNSDQPIRPESRNLMTQLFTSATASLNNNELLALAKWLTDIAT